MPTTSRPYTTALTRVCKHCAKAFNAKGHFSHERACGLLHLNAERDEAYEIRLIEENDRQLERELLQRAEEESQGLGSEADTDADVEMHDLDADDLDADGYSGSVRDSSLSADEEMMSADDEMGGQRDLGSGYKLDDIRVEYHPKSKLDPVVYHFQDYRRVANQSDIKLEDEPWRPFICRGDFEFAEIAMEAALSPKHINGLVKLIKDVASGKRFTISGDSELSRIWKLAAEKLTPFQKKTITVPLRNETRDYVVWYRPLWDWTLDLLSERQLAPHFVWNAEKLYKFDNSTFVRFINEPWTADRFWNIQSTLPNKSRLFCWVLYADKNKLSSFGTEKGHPIIARCANLPSSIRNGNGIGGGCVVGWLPVIKEEAANRNKLTFTNHKRSVWHAALRKILKSLVQKSKSGYWYRCADGKKRKIFPCILIMSGDYEEQCFMTLIRGLKGLYPCPVCLIYIDEQDDLTIQAPLRTQNDTKKLIKKVESETQADAEETLKDYGLRNIKNAFWKVGNSDPHCAVSWDRLHSYSTGVFGKHLWSNFKLCFKDLGRSAETMIDEQFDLVPRFRDLHHFSEAVHISFNDGSKFEDLAKQLLFVAHNVLTMQKSPHGYILLQCLRSFITLDTILSLELQTEATIELGRQELHVFSGLIYEYSISIPQDTDMSYTYNWCFIKMHYQQHAFDDVLAKGVTKNYNTKPNEKLHKPLREAYLRRTNFKEVAGQILKAEHYLLITSLIRSRIVELDELVTERNNDEMACHSQDLVDPSTSSHHHLGAIHGNKQTFYGLEMEHYQDLAFRDFRKKLNEHLNDFFPAHSIPLPNDKRIQLRAHDQLTEYRLLKVNYESKVTWQEVTDILRCSPEFHKKERFDSIIFRTVNKNVFARLICLIGCYVDGTEYHVALVQPCDASIGVPRTKDIDLGLYRVKAKPRSSPEVISVHTIIRGAVLVPDFEKEGEFLVMDILDTDMFLRVKEMRSQRLLS